LAGLPACAFSLLSVTGYQSDHSLGYTCYDYRILGMVQVVIRAYLGYSPHPAKKAGDSAADTDNWKFAGKVGEKKIPPYMIRHKAGNVLCIYEVTRHPLLPLHIG
jgi:hypothetical protein